MKILFYDIDNFEHEHFLKNSLNSIEAHFFKLSLNESTFIDKKYQDTEALSIFIQSNLTKEVLSKFKNLKFIFLRSTGYSNVDLEYCKSNNIFVFNVPNYGTNSVAEFAIALILNISRNIIKANDELKNGYIDKEALTGFELNSKTLGVIGVGAIGKRVLEIAHGFNMKSVAYDIIKNGDYDYVSIDELFKEADFIVLTCPLTSKTKYLINHKAFLKMKKTAFLVNVSRGEIIETESLYDAVVNKRILGAALDVVECEETLCKIYDKCLKNEIIKSDCIKKYLFTTKLMKMGNIIITPHIAYNTVEAKKKIINTTIENIKSSFNINSGTKNLVLV